MVASIPCAWGQFRLGVSISSRHDRLTLPTGSVTRNRKSPETLTSMLEINYPDKILAGVHQSYTLLTDEGLPQGSVALGSVALGSAAPLTHRVIPLGPPKSEPSGTPLMKYKVTFFLPADAVGKELAIRFQVGASKVEDKLGVIAG
jgi:hypothetical protein